MTELIIILVVVASILLALMVLAQSPKGSGLSSQFGGSGATQLMGAKRTVDVIEKMTWGTVILIFILCFMANVTLDTNKNPGGVQSPNMEAASEKSTATGAGLQQGTSSAATSTAAPENTSAATSSGN
ncbi:MAG: preprotein translocase subunit SecG [Cytophagales bacterium]|nr:MAG: preprotein translocase subunit SecG [Cytophagales bacterium]TAF59688.1 MAG: preprotein translocase subunit SecG [Cytophagales bacterium]